MKRLEVSCAVRLIYKSLGAKGLKTVLACEGRDGSTHTLHLKEPQFKSQPGNSYFDSGFAISLSIPRKLLAY